MDINDAAEDKGIGKFGYDYLILFNVRNGKYWTLTISIP
jgi:hypothetical protein